MNFTELPKDGQAFEQMIRELLFSRGLHVQWSGKGADGGRDLICRETLEGLFTPQTRTWLVQCKHNAHGAGSVGIKDLDDIMDSCEQHSATGYLLACSTQPSSSVVNRLEAITNNPKNDITATYWDAVTIERLLSTTRDWTIAQRFMPKSSGDWKIYATETPNDFVAHYKGYFFHLSNRIGSKISHHLESIEHRIVEIEKIELPKNHSIRPRSIWYDDKNGGYTYYLDYMLPHKERPIYSKSQIGRLLGDGYALDDGQIYTFDIKCTEYSSFSDHYDEDHYDYYSPYIPNFLTGRSRNSEQWREYHASQQEIEELERESAKNKNVAFDEFISKLEKMDFLTVMRAVNCSPECISKLQRRFVWTDIIDNLKVDPENLLSATVTMSVSDNTKFHEMVSHFPQGDGGVFRLSRVYVYTFDGLDFDEDEYVYDLCISILPPELTNEYQSRKVFDEYFTKISNSIV